SPPPARIAGDLVLDARWSGAADLDLTVVTPEGTRLSWMGGRTGIAAADVTSDAREQLAIGSLRRGNYLIEISRGDGSLDSIRGTVEISVLGTRRALPFELTGARAVVGRIAVALEERLEPIQPSSGLVELGGSASRGSATWCGRGCRRSRAATAPSSRGCQISRARSSSRSRSTHPA
ncbi:MAG: hypothetical protein ACTHU0_15945, partial [Kofleriaceae bacterium]